MNMAEMGLEPVTTGICNRRNGVQGSQFARQQFRAAHVRFGSEADIQPCLSDVRFTPKSGHGSAPALNVRIATSTPNRRRAALRYSHLVVSSENLRYQTTEPGRCPPVILIGPPSRPRPYCVRMYASTALSELASPK